MPLFRLHAEGNEKARNHVVGGDDADEFDELLIIVERAAYCRKRFIG